MDRGYPDNLPTQPNVLVGREQELKTALELLLSKQTHTLNLTGPPGVGKTRLAVAVAESTRESFPDGIWFIDLAPLRDPSLVGSKVASLFGITEMDRETTLNSLAAFLRNRQLLLFLDNFEGVLEAGTWLGELLERTPGLKILTTSRERLRLRWETNFPVPPLPLPDLSSLPEPSTLMQIPSIALFVQRASTAGAGFVLSEESASTIATLCIRLDGLPLAIELAAARTNVLSPAEILANMNDRFRLLGSGAADLPERHKTLKAAIDWSYTSLSAREAQFLRKLAVFSGGFLPAAVAQVCSCDGTLLDVLDSLITLTEKGLVIKVQGRAGESRFGLLESIREYLSEQLRISGEWDDTRRLHAYHYLELAEQSYFFISRADRNPWLELLEIEHNNLRVALQWSLDTSEYSLGKRMAAALWNPFWWFYGHMREGIYWLETFLERSGDCDGECRDETHMRVLAGAGTLRGYQKDFDAGKKYLLEALQIAEEREDQAAASSILGRLGWIFWSNGKTDEASWLAERLENLPTDASPWDLAYAFLGLGNLQYEAGMEDAEAAYSKSLECFNLADEKGGVFIARGQLALIKYDKGFHQSAMEDMIASLHGVGELRDLHVIAQCVEAAGEMLAKELAIQKRAERPYLEKLAHILGWLDYSREILHLLRNPRQRSVYLKVSEYLQDRLGTQHFLRAWNDGKAASSHQAIQEITEILKNAGQPPRAARPAIERDEIEIPLSPREHQVLTLVAEGFSGQQIAERLFITERTVRFHITSIYNKLGAKNRAQAVAIANRLELI